MNNIIIGLTEINHGIQSINQVITSIASDSSRAFIWIIIVVVFVTLFMHNTRAGLSFIGIVFIIGMILGGA